VIYDRKYLLSNANCAHPICGQGQRNLGDSLIGWICCRLTCPLARSTSGNYEQTDTFELYLIGLEVTALNFVAYPYQQDIQRVEENANSS
jgi:hypothetical protein